MSNDQRDRVIDYLRTNDVGLSEHGLTVEKIRDRAWAFRFEEGESLAFRIERHPTPYLSDQVGPAGSPARLHVRSEFRLDLTDRTWEVEDLETRFEYTPWLVIEEELQRLDTPALIEEQAQRVRNADDPEAAFQEEFGSMIDHWEEFFSEVHGHEVPEEDRREVVDLLVERLRSMVGME